MSHQNPTIVRDLMTSNVVTIGVDASFQEAAALMDQHRISGLPVVDHTGILVGVISHTDLLRSRATEHLWKRWPGLAVRHLMTSPAVTIADSATVEEATALMERRRIHRVVVVSPGDEAHPIGILSTTDVVRAYAGRNVDGAE